MSVRSRPKNPPVKSFTLQHLKDVRTELGMNKSELGRLARVSARSISNIEKGSGAKLETIQKIVLAIEKHGPSTAVGMKELRPDEIKPPRQPTEPPPKKKPKKKRPRNDEI